MKYPISEIFTSVQGEGQNSGRLCTFIRLAGCNLNCSFCDSKDTWNLAKGKMKSVSEIVEMIDTNFIVITGGEPLIHDLSWLINGIRREMPRAEFAIETNGTLTLGGDLGKVFVACSPKPGEYKINVEHMDEIKLVVCDNLTVEVVERIIKENVDIPIFLQPEYFGFDESVRRALTLLRKYPERLRLGIQAHKYWGVE